MSDYTYSQLDQDDTDALEHLNAVFADAFQDPDTYLAKKPSRQYLSELLGLPICIVLVARDTEDGVVGGLVAYELKKFEQERSEIYIYDLAVTERHRRRGVATQLVEELKEIGRARSAYVIFVQADEGDTPAITLYEKLSSEKAHPYHFDIPVKDPE